MFQKLLLCTSLVQCVITQFIGTVAIIYFNWKLFISQKVTLTSVLFQVINFPCYMTVLLLISFAISGILVDSTGLYFYVFFACSAVVASSAIFLLISFYCLDNKDRTASKHCQLSTLSETSRPAVDVVPDCQYSSLPTEGDKDKTSANGLDKITSV